MFNPIAHNTPFFALAFASLVRVVVLVVRLVFSLLSVVNDAPRALRDGLGILHAIEFVGRLVDRPLGWLFDLRRFVRGGHHPTPSTVGNGCMLPTVRGPSPPRGRQRT